MEFKTATDKKGTSIISISGQLDAAAAESFKSCVKAAFEKAPDLVVDLDNVEDITEEGLYALLDAEGTVPEGCSLDIINGGYEIDSILQQTGFKSPEDEDEGFYSMEKADLPEDIKKRIPQYCIDVLDRLEGECDAAVDENGDADGYIIYTVDRYKKEAVIYWVYGEERLAEFFLVDSIRERLSVYGIDKIRDAHKEAAKEENRKYIIEGSLWEIFVNLERNND